ncbi:MAG TPA: 4Fe-4S binding protein [Candidatus Krumholzibacterium sp.]|nr:4Fe-4S binding protein [Candidatus Krumholzibacterium sp.]
MKRNIIVIDEEKCNGCGLCVPDCPEGALQIIDGKARLISDLFCDGLGACIGTCPEGAISIEEREAEPYDERKVMENVIGHGRNTIIAHLEHLRSHGEKEFLKTALIVLEEKGIEIDGFTGGDMDADSKAAPAGAGCQGCPGSIQVDMREEPAAQAESGDGPGPAPSGEIGSELRQWPVQLKLLNPAAPYFDGADLLIAADCSPFAYADFHRKFVKGRTLIMFCPKLDPYIDEYVEKLAVIFRDHRIKTITILKMEVPCCSGVTAIVRKALGAAGVDIEIKEITVSIRGSLIR